MAANNNGAGKSTTRTPRRMGLTRNADGTLTMSLCRAKPGNEGKGRCPHFAHGTREQMSQLITEYTVKKDSGMMDGVSYQRDMFSPQLAFREHLISTGHSPRDLNEDGDIVDEWFDGDREEYKKAVKTAVEEGALGNFHADEDIREDVGELTGKGIKVSVVSDRMIGIRDNYDADTSIWMTANDVDGEPLDGEPPVQIFTGEPDNEAEATDDIRDSANIPVRSVPEDVRTELDEIRYTRQ